MDANQAQSIAEKLVATQDNRGFRLKFAEARKDERWPGEWSVVFDVFNPNGSLMDGPVVVIVNEQTREARYL